MKTEVMTALVFGSRPASDLSDRSAPGALTVQRQLPLWLLRGGLAFVFAYAATAMVMEPAAFVTYVPALLRGSSLATPFLLVIAAFEVLLTIGLLLRRCAYVAALLSAVMMVAIVSCNLSPFEVLFRNVAIACAALSLALQIRNDRPQLAE